MPSADRAGRGTVTGGCSLNLNVNLSGRGRYADRVKELRKEKSARHSHRRV